VEKITAHVAATSEKDLDLHDWSRAFCILLRMAQGACKRANFFALHNWVSSFDSFVSREDWKVKPLFESSQSSFSEVGDCEAQHLPRHRL
jgi:hypothetical protein